MVILIEKLVLVKKVVLAKIEGHIPFFGAGLVHGDVILEWAWPNGAVRREIEIINFQSAERKGSELIFLALGHYFVAFDIFLR